MVNAYPLREEAMDVVEEVWDVIRDYTDYGNSFPEVYEFEEGFELAPNGELGIHELDLQSKTSRIYLSSEKLITPFINSKNLSKKLPIRNNAAHEWTHHFQRKERPDPEIKNNPTSYTNSELKYLIDEAQAFAFGDLVGLIPSPASNMQKYPGGDLILEFYNEFFKIGQEETWNGVLKPETVEEVTDRALYK